MPFYIHISQSTLLVSEGGRRLCFQRRLDLDRWLLGNDGCAFAGRVLNVQCNILGLVRKVPVVDFGRA